MKKQRVKSLQLLSLKQCLDQLPQLDLVELNDYILNKLDSQWNLQTRKASDRVLEILRNHNAPFLNEITEISINLGIDQIYRVYLDFIDGYLSFDSKEIVISMNDDDDLEIWNAAYRNDESFECLSTRFNLSLLDLNLEIYQQRLEWAQFVVGLPLFEPFEIQE